MQGWHTTYLGMRELPREISTFEMQAFFTFECAEREVIDARRSNPLKLGLALHIGFLRMSGRPLSTFRVVPPALWRHLGNELGIDALRAQRPSNLPASTKRVQYIVLHAFKKMAATASLDLDDMCKSLRD